MKISLWMGPLVMFSLLGLAFVILCTPKQKSTTDCVIAGEPSQLQYNADTGKWECVPPPKGVICPPSEHTYRELRYDTRTRKWHCFALPHPDRKD